MVLYVCLFSGRSRSLLHDKGETGIPPAQTFRVHTPDKVVTEEVFKQDQVAEMAPPVGKESMSFAVLESTADDEETSTANHTKISEDGIDSAEIVHDGPPENVGVETFGKQDKESVVVMQQNAKESSRQSDDLWSGL